MMMRSDRDRMDQIVALMGESTIRVRIGEAADVPQLENLARRALTETIDHALGIDDAKIAEILRRCGDPAHVDMGLVAEDTGNGHIVGFLYATGGPHLYAPVAVAVCQIIYVVPEKRWSLAPFLLIREFVRRAIRGGAGLITTHVSSGYRVRETHKFLTKMNFVPTGGNYMMIVRSDAHHGGPRLASASKDLET